MYKVIALIGEAGSGKDSLLHKVMENNSSFHEIISYTSRPIREGEVDGINYHYLTTTEFLSMVYSGKMLESSCFNHWYYGTGIDDLRKDQINIGVFNPEGIRSLLKYDNIEVKIYYVRAADKTRLLRQLNREEHPDIEEIIRRFTTDKADFKNLNFSYTVLENEIYDDLLANVMEIMSCIES